MNSNQIAKHELHGNTSEKISIFVNSILAVLTLIAIYFSYSANQISQNALQHAIKKDSLDGIKQNLNDITEKDDRIFNREYISSSLNINKQYAQAMQKQAIVSERGLSVAENNSKSAKKSVDINEKSAEFYKQSILQQNRAYLVINTITTTNITKDSIEIEISIKNVGKTPAYKVKASWYLLFKKEETAIDTKWLSENYYRSNEIIIGSDQTQAYSKKSDIIHASFTDFQNNKVDLFAMFKVQYVDVFNIVHKTRLFAKRNGSEKEFSTCKKFNDAN